MKVFVGFMVEILELPMCIVLLVKDIITLTIRIVLSIKVLCYGIPYGYTSSHETIYVFVGILKST